MAPPRFFRARVLIDTMTMAREDGLPLKFEILNLVAELSQMNNNFDLLGQKCDLLEAIYCDIAWQGQCQFYELFQTPLGVAVNHHHPLAGKPPSPLRTSPLYHYPFDPGRSEPTGRLANRHSA